jgi:hypothetical protein
MARRDVLEAIQLGQMYAKGKMYQEMYMSVGIVGLHPRFTSRSFFPNELLYSAEDVNIDRIRYPNLDIMIVVCAACGHLLPCLPDSACQPNS